MLRRACWLCTCLALITLAFPSCTANDEPKSDIGGIQDSATNDDQRAQADQATAKPDAGLDATRDADALNDATTDGALDGFSADSAAADGPLGPGCMLLDDIPAGSLSTWTGGDTRNNPVVTWSEQAIGHEGSTAIYATCIGNTVSYCETENIYKEFDLGSQNSSQSALRLFFKATSNQTYYNATFVYVSLFGDEPETALGSAGYYLDAGVGQHPAKNYPSTYFLMEPTDSADIYRLPLDRIGTDIAFTKVRVYFMSYACEGENTSVLDQISFCRET